MLIAGTVDDPKVTVKANASEANSLELNIGDGSTHIIIKSDGTVILASGGSTISVKKDGLIDIQSAGDINIKGGKINMTGDVIVKGTLDVQ